MEFEIDERNLYHFLVDHPERGITKELLLEVVSNEPRVIPNPPMAGRSASHTVIGPDRSGRFWSFPSLHIVDDRYRPITGWPSTNTEIHAYREQENG